MIEVRSPLQGTIVSLEVAPGDVVRAGAVLLLIESMKMHHDVVAADAGRVAELLVDVGTAVMPGDLLVRARAGRRPRRRGRRRPTVGGGRRPRAGAVRADLAESLERHRVGLDEARPDAVARRRARRPAHGPRERRRPRRRRARSSSTARSSSPPSAAGATSTTSSPTRRPTAWSAASARSTASCSGPRRSRCDRRVLRLHRPRRHPGHAEPPQEGPPVRARRAAAPADRVLHRGRRRAARRHRRHRGRRASDCLAFLYFAELSGLVPLVGVNAGYCFAGNAAILGCCDVVIATDGLEHRHGRAGDDRGRRARRVRADGGRADRRAAGQRRRRRRRRRRGRGRRRRQAVPVVLPGPRRRLGRAPTRTLLRDVVPADRLRSYDVRKAVELLFDTGSVLELRRDFGLGMITALARIEGRPVGVIANNPTHLAGAIDTPGADKAARFMQLCDAFDLPIITLCDTPGMMVGPDVEATALVRHCSRLFVTGANVTVPTVTIVLRKAYGLGAQAMMGGSTKAPLACLAWPTGEFGGMGLEGAVRLGYRRGARRRRRPGRRARSCSSELVDRHVRDRQGAQRGLATSRSTTSSTRPTPAAGSPPLLDARRRRCPAPARSARTSTPGERRARRSSVWPSSSRLAGDRAAGGRLRLRARRRPAAVGRPRSPRRRHRGAQAGHVHQQLPGVDRAPRHRPRRRRPACSPAPRSACRSACSCSCAPTTAGWASSSASPCSSPWSVIATGVDLRHAGPGLDVAGGAAVGRADDVGRRQRAAARVRAAGPALRPATASGPRSRRLRRARHRQRRRLRRRPARSTGTSSSPSPSPCRASALGAAAGHRPAPPPRCPPLPPPRAHPAHRRRHLGAGARH